jgi:transposase
MGKALHQSKRDAIETRIKEGVPHFAIAEEMKVSIDTVKHYSSNLKNFGTVILPSISRRGRKPILTREMVEVGVPKAQSDLLYSGDVYQSL